MIGTLDKFLAVTLDLAGRAWGVAAALIGPIQRSNR